MAINDVARQGKIIPETCVDIGRSGLGVSVRKGARTPYIGSVEYLHELLVVARCLVS